jgi:hypothetical protein
LQALDPRFYRIPVHHVADTFSLTIITFLFALSVFGEDALVNVSVEKKDDNDGKLAGYIRIRSKTQGIALSLGDRITTVQRGLAETKQ